MTHLILLLALVPSLIVADHLAVPDHDLEHLKCDLECHNNGVCRFLTRERQGLQQHMQSGTMVQQCICPLGFHGMACDVNVAEHPHCTTSGDCDCAGAKKLSVFAGEQCRKPFTEYCANLQNSVGQHLSYCTNGGKCRGDLFAARIEPGDTSSNYVFQHTGCVCPPEFIGEHCALLNKDGIHDPKYHQQSVTIGSTTGQEQKEMGKAAAIVICVGALFVMVAVALLKMRSLRNIGRRHETAPTELPLKRYREIYLDNDDDSDDESTRRRDRVIPPLA